MSVTIEGWIEFRHPKFKPFEDEEEWNPIVDAGWLMPQNSSGPFGCLFGVKNYCNWKPVASDRGVPGNASKLVRNQA